MCPTTNWIGNCIFVMVWIRLLPICISISFCSISVQFLSNVGNFLYICDFSNCRLIPIWGFWNGFSIIFFKFICTIYKAIWCYVIFCIVTLSFLIDNSWWRLVIWLGTIGNLKCGGHVLEWIFFAWNVNVWPSVFCNMILLCSVVLAFV